MASPGWLKARAADPRGTPSSASTSKTAELNRPPFDLVEAEQELVGGYFTEYSSMRFGLFYLAEFMNTITMSAIIVTLFFGGPDGPWFHSARWLGGVVWFLAKTVVFLFSYVWLRATLPRFRYDQVMDLGWKRLIPLSLGWLLVLAAMIVGRGWGFSVVAGGLVFIAMLTRAVQVGRASGADELAPGHVGEAG